MDLIQPERTAPFEELSKKAYDYLNEQQEIMKSQFDMGSYERWHYNQRTGQLTFSDEDQIKLLIKYEEVGSISKTSDTWLWAWANPHLEDTVKSAISAIKDYGEEHQLELLTKPKWYADQYDGWEMTGVAAYLMKAKGAYRVPSENVFSFMIFKEIFDMRE